MKLDQLMLDLQAVRGEVDDLRQSLSELRAAVVRAQRQLPFGVPIPAPMMTLAVGSPLPGQGPAFPALLPGQPICTG